jgi:cytidyltransferase-like protein
MKDKYDISVISGFFFNPIHCGHLDYIDAAAALGKELIVIVNSDEQVKIKGSVPFMDERSRKRIASSIKGVSESVIAIDKDGSVCQTLKLIRNLNHDKTICFGNGGDRKSGNIPEYTVGEEYNIDMVFNVGGEKTQSSSELIRRAGDD